jgi:AcrR family transcriptional regulator
VSRTIVLSATVGRVPRIATLPPVKDSEPRARLLATASELFYREGVNSVGVERIVSAANVTRATFYRHFPSKQDLVLAYLQSAHDVIEGRIAPALAIEDARARLRAIGADIAAQLRSPGFGGCAFIKVASEFDDPGEPVRRAVAAHRAWFAELVRTAFADAGHVRPDDPARHFIMLRDGAMVAGYLDGTGQAAATFTRGVDGLLRHIETAQ